MACPICVIDGAAIAACRFLGVPDIITVFFLGVMVVPLAISTSRQLNAWPRWATVRYQVLMITTLYAVVTLLVLDAMDVIPL